MTPAEDQLHSLGVDPSRGEQQTQHLAAKQSRGRARIDDYDYADKLAPGKKETITVTIDGAKAKAGPLHEALTASAKKDSSITASFEVNAVIR